MNNIYDKHGIDSTAQTLERLFKPRNIPKQRQSDLAASCGLQDSGLPGPRRRACVVNGKGVGLTRELTFTDGKTVHEVLIVNHRNFIGFPTRCPTRRRSRGTTIFAPSSCNRWALARLIFFIPAIFTPMERPRHRSKACCAIFTRGLRGSRMRLERQLHDSAKSVAFWSSKEGRRKTGMLRSHRRAGAWRRAAGVVTCCSSERNRWCQLVVGA